MNTKLLVCAACVLLATLLAMVTLAVTYRDSNLALVAYSGGAIVCGGMLGSLAARAGS